MFCVRSDWRTFRPFLRSGVAISASDWFADARSCLSTVLQMDNIAATIPVMTAIVYILKYVICYSEDWPLITEVITYHNTRCTGFALYVKPTTCFGLAKYTRDQICLRESRRQIHSMHIEHHWRIIAACNIQPVLSSKIVTIIKSQNRNVCTIWSGDPFLSIAQPCALTAPRITVRTTRGVEFISNHYA